MYVAARIGCAPWVFQPAGAVQRRPAADSASTPVEQRATDVATEVRIRNLRIRNYSWVYYERHDDRQRHDRFVYPRSL